MKPTTEAYLLYRDGTFYTRKELTKHDAQLAEKAVTAQEPKKKDDLNDVGIIK